MKQIQLLSTCCYAFIAEDSPAHHIVASKQHKILCFQWSSYDLLAGRSKKRLFCNKTAYEPSRVGRDNARQLDNSIAVGD